MCLRNILGRGLVSLARIDLRSSGSNCVDMPIVIDPLALRLRLARDDLGLVGTQVSSSPCAMCASHRALATELKSLPTGYREARCLRLETNTRDFEALPSVPKDLRRMDNDMCRPFLEKDGPWKVHWECRPSTEAVLHSGGQGCGGKQWRDEQARG